MSSKRTSNGPKVVTWSHEEDKCLARAWCGFRDRFKNTDPRKIEEFWEDVAAYYNENRPTGAQLRPWDTVNARCFHMMLDVNLLSDVFEKCYNNRASDQSVDDVLEVALAQWRNKYSKEFKYAHVWKLMTELEMIHPQQSDDHHANKKSRASELRDRANKKSRTSELDDRTANNKSRISGFDDGANNKLRISEIDDGANKKSKISEFDDGATAKKKSMAYEWDDDDAKKKSMTSESDDDHTSSESEVRLCAMEDERGKRREKVEVESCGKMQQIQEERTKQRGIKLMHKDFDVIMLDTSGMTDVQRQVHCKFVEQIRARRNW